MTDPAELRDARTATLRTLAAFGFALAFAAGAYLLLSSVRPANGLVGFTFLLVLPAAISAFVSYVADPWRERTRRQYLMVPVWLLLVIVLASIAILHEGVICVLILSPLWLLSGVIGANITYAARRRVDEDGTTYCVAVLILPIVAMQVEPYVPLPIDDATVSRSIVVAAPPAAIWPLLRGIPDVRPTEGRWNVTQDVIGVPRPLGARLVGAGVGADRYADWGEHVKFRERITAWRPGERIGWRFIFDDMAGWGYTDRHLMPDSPYFRVTTGGYRMEPLSGGRTRVTLDTRYRIRTPVNLYSEAWGQLFLGDLEDNLLAMIKYRAEHGGRPPSD